LLIARWRFVPVLMRVPCVILVQLFYRSSGRKTASHFSWNCLVSNAAKYVVNGKNNLPKFNFSHKHIFMSFEVNDGQA
jgi:hypothetical protein